MGKLELIIFGVSGFLAFNAYYDNYYIQKIKSHKKMFEVAMYLFLGFSFYLLIKRSPHRSKEMLSQASNMVKYLPIDKGAFSMVTPFLNLTGSGMSSDNDFREQRILQSGGNNHLPEHQTTQQPSATKRSVSETKKKWVASQQNWTCNHCNQQLPAWFEVDHKVRLEYGGSNHVDNLEALCRDCHGKKTAMEKF